jgi:hypothetical protein
MTTLDFAFGEPAAPRRAWEAFGNDVLVGLTAECVIDGFA